MSTTLLSRSLSDSSQTCIKFVLMMIIVVVFTAVACFSGCSKALEINVGGNISKWTIPPNNDFYSRWSSSNFFQIGDNLVFEFESEFHNVMQVSRREYESCTAESPFQAFSVGPATVPLIQEGAYYFICSIANHCVLGQKLSITVHPYSDIQSHQLQPSAGPILAPISSCGHEHGRPGARVESSVLLLDKRRSASMIPRALGCCWMICVILVFVV